MSSTNPKTFTFQPPALNTDGSPVVAGEIDKYVIATGKVSDPQTFPISFNDTDVTPAADGTLTAAVSGLGNLADGDYVAVVYAHTAAGQQSAASNPVQFSIVTPPTIPNPPTNFTAA